MLCIYRISDGSQSSQSKPKLEGATKEACLRNFVRVFGTERLHIVADNIGDATLAMIREVTGAAGMPEERIHHTDFGSGAYSFLHAVRLAIGLMESDTEPIYLVEDDYLHTPDAPRLLLEGLQVADYCTGYDHPDKYIHTLYPQLLSRLFVTEGTHWRTTPSTTMTFATTLGVLRKDLSVYERHCVSGYPHDHEMFGELWQKHRRVLVSAVPGFATHTEKTWLGPRVDWQACTKH
jgi:hypothetical protein